MAGRNLLRSLLAASVMVVSCTTGLLGASAVAAGAIENPDHRVTVYETHFDPPIIYAAPRETVQFDLAPGVSANHTVTLENGTCAGRPSQVCERDFEDPENPPVFRFSDYGEYRYFDRFARDAENHNMRGVIVVTDTPPPTTTSTLPPTTTSTQPATTTTQPATSTTLAPATTTTTAPSTIRPLVIADPPTTTTTAPVATGRATAGPSKGRPGVSPNGSKDKQKGKSDDKGKAAETEAPTTTLPESGPLDVIFDAASLTPVPESSLADPATTSSSGPEEAALVDLLGAEKSGENKTFVRLIGLAVLAFVVLGGGLIAWYHRSSRYIPA